MVLHHSFVAFESGGKQAGPRSIMQMIKKSIADIVLWAIRLGARLIGGGPAAYLAERLELVARVSIPGGQLALLQGNTAQLYRARTVLTKEPETVTWIDAFPEGSSFWDIGANVGVYSLYAARRRGAQVLAFEPGAANYYSLNRNIELNDAGGQVQAFCLAFSASSQMGTLNMTSTRAGGATNNFDKTGLISPYATDSGHVFRQGMLGMSIDEFVKTFSPRLPEYMKIDVDGIEEMILRGATETLANPRLRSVLIELETIHEAPYQRCLNYMQSAGFHLSRVGEFQAEGSTLRPRNHIFAR